MRGPRQDRASDSQLLRDTDVNQGLAGPMSTKPVTPSVVGRTTPPEESPDIEKITADIGGSGSGVNASAGNH